MLAQQLLHGKSLATLVAQELRDVQVLHHMVLQPGLGPVNKMEEKDHRQLSQMLHHMVPVLQPGLGPVKKMEEKDHRQLSQVLHHMVLQPGLGPVKQGKDNVIGQLIFHHLLHTTDSVSFLVYALTPAFNNI